MHIFWFFLHVPVLKTDMMKACKISSWGKKMKQKLHERQPKFFMWISCLDSDSDVRNIWQVCFKSHDNHHGDPHFFLSHLLAHTCKS